MAGDNYLLKKNDPDGSIHEEMLSRSLMLIAQQAQSAIFICRKDGSFIYINDYGKKFFGCDDQKKAEKLSLKTVLPSEFLFERIISHLKNNGAIHGLETFVSVPETDKEIPVRIMATEFKIKPDLSLIGGVFQDISQETELLIKLTEAHNRYRTTMDAVADAIFSVNLRKEVVSANLAFEKIVDRKMTEMMGLPFQEIMRGNCKNRCIPMVDVIDDAVSHVFETKSPWYKRFNCSLDMLDRYWIDVSVYPVLGVEGDPIQATIVIHDATEEAESRICIETMNKELKTAFYEMQKKNQELERVLKELKETQAHLLQSEKMASIGQLAAGIAHEINNPVGFIDSNLKTLHDYASDMKEIIKGQMKAIENLIEKRPGDYQLETLKQEMKRLEEDYDMDFVLEDMDQLIGQCLEGTNRVKQIVRDLKEFSHADHGELEYADLNKGMESTLNIVWNELKYKATLEKEYEQELPPLLCYPQQLNQVFMNLLVNAAQAIENKGKIIISTKRVSVPRDGIEIVVEDTGCGISDEIKNRIFDPFYTTKPVGKGTGLGLNVSYKIIKAHGGKIEVESEVGKGSRFVVFLPFLTEEEFKEEGAEQS